MSNYWGILGKNKKDTKFSVLDYAGGQLVINVLYATLWPKNKEAHVRRLVDKLNEQNSGHEFKMIKR